MIRSIASFENQVTTIHGWVYQKRSSGKIKFLQLRDGSGIIQCVFANPKSPAFELFETLTQESSVEITGLVKKDSRSTLGFELEVHDLKIFQIAQNYPITPKEHGIPFLMEHRHLWIRSQRQWAILRIRSHIIHALSAFFDQEGFVRFDTPILTPSACEGTSTLFATDYFDEQAFLTQSGQLYGEAGAAAFGKIYTFGPTFRAEKSKTRKHLTEFWMLEPEVAFATLPDVMLLAEKMILFVIQSTLTHKKEELALLERDLEPLKKIHAPFPRVSYDEALQILEKKGLPLAWGEDLGAPHETALGEAFESPLFLHHMPSQIKAFYFKQSDTLGIPSFDSKLQAGKYALGCDLIAPSGYGEIIGGGQREENVDILSKRLQEHELSSKEYEWYLDLRRFGSIPHGGFGLGLERLVAWITGAEHVRETIPFPRLIHSLRP